MMLVAHVEQDGVWLAKGGMCRVADAMQKIAARHGAVFRFGAHVAKILVNHGIITGVVLEGGERLDADAVVFNGDSSALGLGLLGKAARGAAEPMTRNDHSPSAITWCLKARTSGFPLEHHNVFFAEDYGTERDAIFKRQTVRKEPTVYVCAQTEQRDRLLFLINAPAGVKDEKLDLEAIERQTFNLLRNCGLEASLRVPFVRCHKCLKASFRDVRALFMAAPTTAPLPPSGTQGQ